MNSFSSSDPLPARPWWGDRWRGVQPAGWALRKAFPERWVRIHSLRDSKRYAETEDEWRELETRHRAAASLLFSGGERVFLMVPGVWAEEGVFHGRGLAPSRRVPEWRPGGDEPPNGPFHAVSFPWEFDFFLPVLRAVADDAACAVVVSADAGRLYAPYDGGADLFFPDAGSWSAARAALAPCLSARPDGL